MSDELRVRRELARILGRPIGKRKGTPQVDRL